MILVGGYHQVKLKKSQLMILVRGYHQVKLKKSHRKNLLREDFFLYRSMQK